MNERLINALRAVITALGGTVPTAGGRHFNQYTLDLVDAAIVAAGGTPRARTGPWNEDLVSGLEKLSTSVGAPSVLATMSFLTTRRVANYTEADPGSIKQSSADTTINGTAGYILAGLTNSAVGSSMPNNALSWSIAGKELNGTAMDSDIHTLLAAVLVWAGADAPAADVCIGAALCDGNVATAQNGFGVRLQASGGRWLVSHLTCSSGTWAASAATATSASIVGAIANAVHLTTATQRSIRARGIDTNGAPVTTNNTPTTAQTATIGDNLTHLALFAGWLTGTGGVNGTQVSVAGHEASLKVTEVTGYAR